jgi:lipoprotein-anchoring transpeptidase ErfK/SrfK
MMIRRIGLLLLTLPVAAIASTAPAAAQYYSSPPPYHRSAPPNGYYDDRSPPPDFWADDDDDDQPVRGRRAPQMSQNPAGAPSRVLPYPNEADAAPPSPPGFAQQAPGNLPAYGHQLDQQAPRAATPNDPDDAVRPPGAIGAAPVNAPGAAQPPPAGAAALPPEDQPEQGQPKELPPNLKRQLVDYNTKEPAGTIIVDTANTYLYLVLGGGKALRYGVRVGREGFTWTGTERISKMKEWPDWFPPPEMIDRQPYLPRIMAGGNGNPLGARAMYLGHTLYRIHGTNQPSTIGHYVSSGCVGMLNEDVEDLYSRVQVGTRVVVLPGKPPETAANTGAPQNAEPANPMAPPNSAASNPPRNGTAISSSPLPPVR